MSRVAYLGSEGSFSSIAAEEMSSSDDALNGYGSFKEVFDSVSSGEADSGVLPIENTIAGSIYDNYDLLREYPLYITAEHYLTIEQSLLVLDDAVTLQDIREILSHQKALEQCGKFFGQHADLNFATTAVSDTVRAAHDVRERYDPGVAAIGNKRAAKLLGLTVLQSNIQDTSNNTTRFVQVQPTQNVLPNEKGDKCSLVIDLPHRRGSLVAALATLSGLGHNIMTANTRPMPNRPWEYLFYVDFVAEEDPSTINVAVNALHAMSNKCTVLGIYEDKSPMTHPSAVID